jgi:YHS domain-containing protein
MLSRVFAFGVLLAGVAGLSADQPEPKKSPREALQALAPLIGAWEGTGTHTDKAKGFWTEKMEWGWKFKDKDAWLVVEFDKSKYYTSGELRYDADKDNFTLTLTTIKKDKVTYVGVIDSAEKSKKLTLEREENKDTERIIFTFLHDNYIRYKYEVKPDGRPLFAKKWDVGAKLKGVEFAGGDGRPLCIVSGGTGTSTVSYMGKTYYVCCSGCRDEFNSAPAKYVAEWDAKQAKLKKK